MECDLLFMVVKPCHHNRVYRPVFLSMNRCIYFIRNPLLSRYRISCCRVKFGINGTLKSAPGPTIFRMMSSSVPVGAAGTTSAEQSDSTATKRTLDYESGPMVWIDLEMTGLDTKVDKIMEIAVSSPIRTCIYTILCFKPTSLLRYGRFS